MGNAMTMQSSNLLPALRELPASESHQHMSFREIVTGLANTDRTMYDAEFASTASIGLWAVFDGINVDDELRETMIQAHRDVFPNETRSVTEHWQDVVGLNDPEAVNNQFMSPLKGRMAEISVKEQLEQNGFTDIAFPRDGSGELDLNNEGWDVSAVGSDGQEVIIQVKTGASDSQYYKTLEAMENTDYEFYVGTEIYDRISETTPELVDRLTDIGSDYLLVENTTDGLNTLSTNKDIDVPDDVVDILPYAGAIIAGARLVYGVLNTEKEFAAADRTTKNQIQVVQTLTSMSRMGINTVLAIAGATGGTAIGSAIAPGIGTIAGGIGGSIGGVVVIGRFLNKHLQPHMLDLALDITGLTRDDLFYYKNKPRINETALSFNTRARELAAAPSV